MRVRKLDADGDMSFGNSTRDFWINTPEAPAQCAMTRLRLSQGDWFANLTDGTPWASQVLGERTSSTRDVVVRGTVLGTQGVTDINEYSSVTDGNTRTWNVAMTMDTVYGAAALALARLPGTLPPGAVVSSSNARLLGIQGSRLTPMTAVPADLTRGPRTDIVDFRIGAIDSGVF